jgi:hypothetical protein
MRTYLQSLKPGTRFRVADMPEVTGTLMGVSDCSATVRIDGKAREVEIACAGGTTRRFTAHRATTTTWAPATVVEPIFMPEDDPSSQHEELHMATKKKTRKKAEGATQTGYAPQSQLDLAETKRLSAIEAAAKVLAESKTAMTAKEMIEAMESQGLWKSPGGKTPHATLYSAIIREIATKGKEARFVKAGQGKFTLANRGD